VGHMTVTADLQEQVVIRQEEIGPKLTAIEHDQRLVPEPDVVLSQKISSCALVFRSDRDTGPGRYLRPELLGSFRFCAARPERFRFTGLFQSCESAHNLLKIESLSLAPRRAASLQFKSVNLLQCIRIDHFDNDFITIDVEKHNSVQC
jgi:hypothetical protein